MTQPIQNLIGRCQMPGMTGFIVGNRSINHYDRQLQNPSRVDFRFCGGASRIFRHDDVNPMLLKQCDVVISSKRTSRRNQMQRRQVRRRLQRIDDTRHVVMLRHRRKCGEVLAADAKKNASAVAVQRVHSPSDIRHVDPGISGFNLPRRALQNRKGDMCFVTGFDHIRTDVRRKRMCCINDMRDFFVSNVAGQSIGAAKPARRASATTIFEGVQRDQPEMRCL